MSIDILAFGAHPDDVELSCGGTLLKNISRGKKVGIIDITRGELGTRGTPAIREREAKAAAKILGVSLRENLKMPDGFFEINKKNILKVIQKIRQYKPEVILAPAIADRHPDHGRAAQLIAEASFLSGLVKLKTRIHSSGASWRPKAVYHYIQYRQHKADFAVDITPFMEKKMQAIRAYASQFYNPQSKEPSTLISQPLFFDYVRRSQEHYGKMIGVKYAEGYNVFEEYSGEVLI